MISFQVQRISFVKRKANSIEQQNYKDHKKRDRLPIFKMEIKLIIRFPSEIKVLPIYPVFSNWVSFNKKVSAINCSTNSKSFISIYFFFEIQKLKILDF